MRVECFVEKPAEVMELRRMKGDTIFVGVDKWSTAHAGLIAKTKSRRLKSVVG